MGNAPSRMAVLVTLVATVLVALSAGQAAPVEGEVSYSDFRRSTFSPLTQQIAAQLTPCGCTIDGTPPTFTFPNAVSFVTYAMMNHGTQQLLEYMRALMAHCGCSDGVGVINAALLATQNPDSDRPIGTRDVDVFVTQITNVMADVIKRCCDPHESPRNFQFILGSFTYAEASEDARNRGGRLASIAARQDCMKATAVLQSSGATSNPVSTPGGSHPFVWIGLEERNLVWTWADGSPFAFANWGFNQPVAEQNCAGFNVATPPTLYSTWAALSCEPTRLPYLLELPPEAAPEEASDTTVILAVIGVLVAVFVLAVIFIVLKRFVPAFRDRERRGRRITRAEAEERTSTAHRRHGRRRRHRGSTGDDGEGEEMAENAAPIGGAAHPASRRSGRRRVNFGEGGADVGATTSEARQRSASQRGIADSQSPNRAPPRVATTGRRAAAAAAAGMTYVPRPGTSGDPATPQPASRATAIPGSPGHERSPAPAPQQTFTLDAMGGGPLDANDMQTSASMMSARSSVASSKDFMTPTATDDVLPPSPGAGPAPAPLAVVEPPAALRHTDPMAALDDYTSSGMPTENGTPSSGGPADHLGP